MQTGPRGRVRLRDHRQFFPRQIRLDRNNIGGGRTGVFCITAVDGTAHTTHEGSDLGADCELASRACFNQSYTLDAADQCSLGPVALSHMGLCTVYAERLNLDQHRAWLRDRIRQFLDDQAVYSAKTFNDDCSHTKSFGCSV